jgi:hypothetical protein
MSNKDKTSEKKEELKIHRKLAGQLFNHTWDLIDKGGKRTPEEDDEMIHSAHASKYHWTVVINSGEYPDTGPVNHARGDWQISRVYSLLNIPESALRYAQKSLQVCLDNDIAGFDLAFGYEAVARAYSLKDNMKEELEEFLNLAKEAGNKIEKESDREYFLSELKTIKT